MPVDVISAPAQKVTVTQLPPAAVDSVFRPANLSVATAGSQGSLAGSNQGPITFVAGTSTPAIIAQTNSVADAQQWTKAGTGVIASMSNNGVLTSKGLTLISPNATSYPITVSNTGLLTGVTAQPLANRVYSAPGAAPGYDTLLDLDFDTSNPSQNESIMVRVRNASNVLTKTFWLNESGLPRAWTVRKEEPSLKLHAYTDNSVSPVLEVRGPWNGGATRRWGINSKGNPLLGPDQIEGVNVIALAVGASVPANLPTGTIIVRY